MSRARRFLGGLAALVALGGLLGGVPGALWRYVGWPLPHGLPTWSQLTDGLTRQGIPDDVLIKTLAVVVWLAWASLVVSVWAEALAVVRGRVAHRLPGLGLVQPFAGYLVAAVALAVLPMADRTPAYRHSPALVVALRPAEPSAALAARPVSAPAEAPTPSPWPAPAAQPPPAEPSYVVQRRDTLWGIAGTRHLGDPLRWSEVFQLNRDRAQPDGGRLTNPNLIRPGWVLALPATATSPAPTSPALLLRHRLHRRRHPRNR